MNHTQGVLLFGLCFFLFLGWLWWYPDDQLKKPNQTSKQLSDMVEVERWLEEHDLMSIKPHLEISGVKTLQDVLTINLDTLETLLDRKTEASLRVALSSLDFRLWLQKWGISDHKLLREKRYTSHNVLCSMSRDEVNEISKKLASAEKRSAFSKAVEEHVKSECRAQEDEDLVVKDDSWWTVTGIMFYFLCAASVAIVILAIGSCVILLLGSLTVLVVLVQIFGTLFFSLINGRRTEFRISQSEMFSAIGGMLVENVGGFFKNMFRNVYQGFTVQGNRPILRSRISIGSQLVGGFFNGLFRSMLQPFTAQRNRPLARSVAGLGSQSPTSSLPAADFSLGLYERFRGTYLNVDKCMMEWNHVDMAQVGGSSVITVKMVCKNETPYKFKASDSFKCKIMSASERASVPHVVEPTSLVDQDTFRVSFTTKVSGRYILNLKINEKCLCGGEIYRKYLPGPVDSNKTVFLDNTAVLLVTQGVYSAMTVIPKDSFGNQAVIEEQLIQIEIRKNCKNGELVEQEFVAYKNDNNCYELLIKLDQEGHYVGNITYGGHRLGPPHFTILSLSEENMKTVEKNVTKKSLNVWYEASIVADKMKKVYCYISPRQLQVREYFMKLFPTRTFTCKVSPSTQITYHADPKMFTLDDGFQESLTLLSSHRDVLGATFHKFVLKNIGGSEKFKDKQTFFYTKLKEHHRRPNRSEKRVCVSRFDLVESARRATKGFSSHDWCKKFMIVFKGEEGLDWGGLSREFFELISIQLFDASNKLFMRFNDDDHQALVHPNYSSHRPPLWKLKHFGFAGKIVGKCLYESAMGNIQLVKARFTRSFLAQLIGLRVNYRYFETDDPSLYTTKVQYILENDVTDLDMVFAEEEFDSQGGPPTVIPLVEDGEELEVTEQNKARYLNVLSQYRFTRRVGDEIEQFLKGLNEIVPDCLLSIFDENELELLMCGMGTVSYDDLKEHAIVSGTSPWFHQVLSWFWTITSNFTQEEMAKLLQFVSGCSQLPPGGFKELNPRFTITSTPTRGRLPTSHTCFNQLCLPEYTSCEQFHTSLMIALNEGSEGFGML